MGAPNPALGATAMRPSLVCTVDGTTGGRLCPSCSYKQDVLSRFSQRPLPKVPSPRHLHPHLSM